jgi:hypothetical protein
MLVNDQQARIGEFACHHLGVVEGGGRIGGVADHEDGLCRGVPGAAVGGTVGAVLGLFRASHKPSSSSAAPDHPEMLAWATGDANGWMTKSASTKTVRRLV